MALIAGMIVTWLQKIEKLCRPSAAARSTVIAVDGAVVSNPIAMNTTRLSGFFRAIFNASSGEYTIRMSAPAAFESKNEPRPPGTRIMSPNDVMITSWLLGDVAIASWSAAHGVRAAAGQPSPSPATASSGR